MFFFQFSHEQSHQTFPICGSCRILELDTQRLKWLTCKTRRGHLKMDRQQRYFLLGASFGVVFKTGKHHHFIDEKNTKQEFGGDYRMVFVSLLPMPSKTYLYYLSIMSLENPDIKTSSSAQQKPHSNTNETRSCETITLPCLSAFFHQ